MKLDYDQAHEFVSNAPDNIRWDGWNIVVFDRRPNAYMKQNGVFFKGQWAEKLVISVSDDGTWSVPGRYIT